MKFTKRILVALLALSILAASFVFVASAEDAYDFTAGEINNIEDILEFYEYGDPMINDLADENEGAGRASYEGAALQYADSQWSTTVAIPGASASGYTVAPDALNRKNVVFEFNVKFDESAIGNVVYELRAKLATGESADATTTSLFVIDLVGTTPAVKYSVWDETSGEFLPDTVALDGITPAADKWYSVAVFFNGENGVYSFEITEEGGETVASPELSLGAKDGLVMFQLRGEFQNYTLAALNTPAKFYVKDVEVYGGTFVRDIDAKDAITSDTLADLGAIYNDADTSDEDKVRIAEVINTLKKYLNDDRINEDTGFTDANTDVETVFNYSYAEAVILAVEAIDRDANYRTRMDHVAKIDRYNEFVADVTAASKGLDADLFAALEAARATLAQEKVDLTVVRAQSVEFINEYMPTYVASTDFDGVVAPFYLKALADYPEMDLEYCEDDADVATVIDNWNTLVAQYAFYKETLVDFAAFNAILNVEAADNFGTRYYDGYLPAKALYETIKENAYIDVTTSADIMAEVAIYELEANAPYMAAEEEKCLNFIKYVSEASVATYYSVLVERLSWAEPLYDVVQTDFEGIVDAKAVYDALSAANEDDVALAQAYIAKVDAAVAALADKTATYATKKAAVDAALAAKETGNLFGYADIKEKNIALSEAEAVLLALKGNSETLISLVAELETATDLAERRVILRNAVAASKGADSTYTGVEAALTALETAVADFTAIVDGANGNLTAAVTNAANIASGTVTDANVYKAASIIKDHAK